MKVPLKSVQRFNILSFYIKHGMNVGFQSIDIIVLRFQFGDSDQLMIVIDIQLSYRYFVKFNQYLLL